jgi:redox-sensing transcriptional repressor
VFDVDQAKVGKKQGPFDPGKREFVIEPISGLKGIIEREGIRLAILAVPADAAQEVADLVVEAGIKGILNFAPVSLNLPSEIALTAVDLAVQLEQLSFQVNFSPLLVPNGK